MDIRIIIFFLGLILFILLINFLVSRIKDKGKRILVFELLGMTMMILATYTLGPVFIFSDVTRNDTLNWIIKIVALGLFLFANFLIFRKVFNIIKNISKGPKNANTKLIQTSKNFNYDGPDSYYITVLVDSEEIELEAMEEDYKKLLKDIGIEKIEQLYYKFEVAEMPNLNITYYPETKLLVDLEVIE